MLNDKFYNLSLNNSISILFSVLVPLYNYCFNIMRIIWTFFNAVETMEFISMLHKFSDTFKTLRLFLFLKMVSIRIISSNLSEIFDLAQTSNLLS